MIHIFVVDNLGQAQIRLETKVANRVELFGYFYQTIECVQVEKELLKACVLFFDEIIESTEQIAHYAHEYHEQVL